MGGGGERRAEEGGGDVREGAHINQPTNQRTKQSSLPPLHLSDTEAGKHASQQGNVTKGTDLVEVLESSL